MTALTVDLATLTAFSVCCMALAVNLMGLWAYSAVVRAGSGTVGNVEDLGLFSADAVLATEAPAAVARVLRAHGNAMATSVPFVLVGLVYVLLGGASVLAWALFAGFVAARLSHAVAYLRGWQPWRTVAFALGVLAMFGCLVLDMLLVVGRLGGAC